MMHGQQNIKFCLEVLFNLLKFPEIPADELLPGSMQWDTSNAFVVQ